MIRQDAYERISALAGVSPEGDILPPPAGMKIDRSPSPFWRNRYEPEARPDPAPDSRRI